MITLMLGKAANGFYSAAVTCASLSQFVFAAIIDSMRPSILETKNQMILCTIMNIFLCYIPL